MRGKLLGGVLALAVAAASFAMSQAFADQTAAPAARTAPDHASDIAIFYYPWYGTPDQAQAWRHWDQGNHTPADDIGSNFYPAAGAYSSNDAAIIDLHMRQMASAGVRTVITSWWGRGSYEDSNLQAIIDTANRYGLHVAAHVEPYANRGATLVSDFAYLQSKGVSGIYLYQANRLNPTTVATASDTVPSTTPVFAESSDARSAISGSFEGWAQLAHVDGVYTYDVLTVDPNSLTQFCDNARAHNLLCAPSVGPGFEGTRATTIGAVRSRTNGVTYDNFWKGAIAAKPDVVTITSFNEWHEGTQIEPAVTKNFNGFNYDTYNGAYGKSGVDASNAYLAQTYNWSAQAMGHELTIQQKIDIFKGTVSGSPQETKSAIGSLKAPWLKQ